MPLWRSGNWRRCDVMTRTATATLQAGPIAAGWTVPWTSEERSRDSGDPLGLRAAANRVARILAPGLSQRSNRVRGFGLAAFGLSKALEFEDVDTAMLVFERAWVLSQVWHERAGWPTLHWAGWQRANRLLDSIPDGQQVPLDRPLLTDQLAGGLWGQYRRASVVIGLLSDTFGAHTSRPRDTKLTGKGQTLVSATKDAAFASLHVADWLSARSVSRLNLGKVKPLDGQPSHEEVLALEQPLGAFDLRHDGALHNLRRCFDAGGQNLSIDKLDTNQLSERQGDAVMTGRAIAEIIDMVEAPYRSWVTGGEPARPELAVVHSTAWDRLRTAGESDSVHLIANLRADRSWEAVHRHHEWMSSSRGARAWEAGFEDPIRARCESPDFGLSSPAHLFWEGVFDGR